MELKKYIFFNKYKMHTFSTKTWEKNGVEAIKYDHKNE